MTEQPAPRTEHRTEFLWLDMTRRCQLNCVHCYNSSGPTGSHGAMSREDWLRVIDQAAACGVRRVQLIGGEPMLYPHALAVADRVLSLGIGMEVYSNLVHVTDEWWALLLREGASLATSYHSAHAGEHNRVTGRPSHLRTHAHIERALRLGFPCASA
ncbi:radical SAM protein [Streptomyces sp. NPDC057702]|uniref:radical SAM protein n=1 Tax=unclassified Streptomyces TaxID=2593676 RepID=UPI0036CAB2D4